MGPQSFTSKNILKSATGKWNLELNLQNPMYEQYRGKGEQYKNFGFIERVDKG